MRPGPTGSSVSASTAAAGEEVVRAVAEECSAIGAPTKATRIRKMMKTPLAIATLSRLKRRQTCSQ